MAWAAARVRATEKYSHPEGHTASVRNGDASFKAKTWSQEMPASNDMKTFSKQIAKALKKPQDHGPKAGHSAMQDSKGRYKKLTPLGFKTGL